MAKINEKTMIKKKIKKKFNQNSEKIMKKKLKKKLFDNHDDNDNYKRILLCRCSTANQQCIQLLKDLYQLKKPNAIYLNRKETIKPFDNIESLEFLTNKNNCSIFMYCSHSKKRPNNLILGRFYDTNILLDMIEFKFENYQSLKSFKNMKISYGIKSIILFSGQLFDNDKTYQHIKSIFLDFFLAGNNNVEQINLMGLEHVIQIIEFDGKIYIRSYRILLKNSGQRQPRVELIEIGPRIDLCLGRYKFANDDIYKKTIKQSIKQDNQKIIITKNTNNNKNKNIIVDNFGTTLGRIHMEQQDYNKLQLRKAGAFKVQLN